MAYLTSAKSDRKYYLKAYHIVGRLEASADMVIALPEVSKIHGVFEWLEDTWVITDLSTNGIWLNGEKVAKSLPQKLKVKDKLSFSPNGDVFIVADDSESQSLLMPIDKQSEAIVLEQYLLLPNEQEPELSLFYDDLKGQWFSESMDSAEFKLNAIADGDDLSIGEQRWRFFLNTQREKTRVLAVEELTQDAVTMKLDVSLDEEMIHVRLETQPQRIDLGVRAHHYLILLLARKRLSDIAAEVPNFDQGWLYSDQLCKDMGLDACHLNIQVHRARKQFADSCQRYFSLPLFERQTGKIRLNLSKIIINKGGKLEKNIA